MRSFTIMGSARGLGNALIILGVVVAAADVAAIATGWTPLVLPWLVNVGLAKLGFIAAGGMMTAGAMTIRVAKVREARRLRQEAVRAIGGPG